jgi:hypothetical protein
MTPVELAVACHNAIARQRDPEAKALIQLVIPRAPRGKRMQVVPGVSGEICCVNSDGHTVVWADAEAILRYLRRKGLVRMRIKLDPPVGIYYEG